MREKKAYRYKICTPSVDNIWLEEIIHDDGEDITGVDTIDGSIGIEPSCPSSMMFDGFYMRKYF